MLTALTTLPKNFPFAFCGYVLDTPTLAVVPVLGNGSVSQGQGMLFLFNNVSGATLGLLASGANGTMTYPLSDQRLYASQIRVQQSISIGSSLLVFCTTLTTTTTLLAGRRFS